MSSFSFSPFAAALPASHAFFAYDADGDAIMTDGVTGLPIVYGGQTLANGGAGTRRARSASLDSDTDSRPSKRSRSSSDDDEDDYADMPALIPANPPPAPKKAARAPVLNPEDDGEDGDGAASAVRNLAEHMAEVVLDGEPRDAPAEWNGFLGLGPGVAPPGGDGGAIGAGAGPAEPPSYCVSVTVSDLALRLDMRHPRVVLHFLRFVSSYNELAPEGEDIHLPLISQEAVSDILSHESIVNPPAEFASEVAELRALVASYSAPPHEDEEDRDGYSTDSEDRRDMYRRDSF